MTLTTKTVVVVVALAVCGLLIYHGLQVAAHGIRMIREGLRLSPNPRVGGLILAGWLLVFGVGLSFVPWTRVLAAIETAVVGVLQTWIPSGGGR